MGANNKGLINELFDELNNDIINKRVAIFFGAGLSKGSGNLLADDIISLILSSMRYKNRDLFDKNTIDALKDRTKQFEDFLSRLFDDHASDDKKNRFKALFEIIYGGGKPIISHYTIAHLLGSKLVKKVYTTNFDCHLEEVCKKNSSKLEIEIVGHSQNPSAQLIKLHGCISKPDEIGTLLERVASIQNQIKIRPHIEDLLVHGKHEAALFMGYSFSDVYDIVKVILEISKSNLKEKNSFKKIYIFAHESNEENFGVYTNSNFNTYSGKVKDLNDYNLLDHRPTREIRFDSFEIIILRCDTSEFVKKLSNKQCLNLKIKEISELDKIKRDIEKWAYGLGTYFNLLIGWRFNYEAGQEYIFSKNEDKRKLMLKALKNASEYCDIILDNWDKIRIESILNRTKKEDIEARLILTKKHQALTLISMGEFPKAEVSLNSLLIELETISSDLLKRWLRVDINANLLYLNYFRILSNNYSERITESIKICEDYFIQLDTRESLVSNSLGYHRNRYLIASLKNRFNISGNNEKTFFLEAIDYYEQQGRVEYLAFVYMEYALFLEKLNDKKCYDYMEMAKELFKNLGYTEYLQFCNLKPSFFRSLRNIASNLLRLPS